MARLILREAGPGDQRALAALLGETAMGRQVRLRIDRSPGYFTGARVQAMEPCVWAAFEGERAVGLFAAGRREVWLAGRRTPLRYLSDLRIHPAWRSGTLLARGYRLLRERVFAPGEWAQTLVLEDNAAALELLTSGRRSLPEYRSAGRYRTWLMKGGSQIAIGAGPDPGPSVRRATPADLPAMQRLYDLCAVSRAFTPALDFTRLGDGEWRAIAIADFLLAFDGDELTGMLGLWDQSSFHRLIVDGYSSALAALRLWINGWARLRRQVALPPAGAAIPLLKATAVSIRHDDPLTLRALLLHALRQSPGKALLAGLSERDPLAAAFTGIPARIDHGRHFLAGFTGDPPEWREPFCFDVARI